jgi:hypothetical protein
MRLAANLVALAALGLSACGYGFDSVCREGEVCDPIEVDPPVTAEPNVGQGPTCSLLSAQCGELELHQACSFRITGNSVDAPPECRSSSGSSYDGQLCMDASFCSLGLTCYRPSADVDGVCVDLCQTVADCQGTSRTCDRSAPITTLGGVPIYRCLDTSP